MPKTVVVAPSAHQMSSSCKKLKTDTLDRIDSLLVKHERDGVNRGLYTLEELRYIRTHLQELAKWLEKNEPDFLKEADENYTHHSRFNEKTVLCISYIDHIDVEKKQTHSIAIQQFFNKHLADLYSHLHILPHFKSPVIHEDLQGPASRADGGFEAMDYKMDADYGDPEDLMKVKAGLMFDFVLNHLSTEGDFFQKFMAGESGFEDFFVSIDEKALEELDLSPVFRPREHYPIIPYKDAKGNTKHIWCTFSETQADINIKDYRVFCVLMEALVKDFIGQGASWIRLDAVGYLVKMLGVNHREQVTSCFGIDETHNVLKAMRTFLDDVAPSVTLVPEVNATGDVIKTYYGTENDEGHLVYEFPSAPLSLFSIYNEDARSILDWARERNKTPECIGLAFTSSHDGVGVLPMNDVADMADGTSALHFLIHQIERRGGGVNYKSKMSPDGEAIRVPYEACITWMQAILTPPEFAALKGDRMEKEEIDLVVDRFMASQSFVYTAPHCVPADYMGVVTSLLNDEDLYALAGHRRNKNRGLVDQDGFEKALSNPETNYEMLCHQVFERKKQMIEVRQSCTSFSPYARCEVDIAKAMGQENKKARPVYSVLRHSPHNDEKVIALTNCTATSQTVSICRTVLDNMCMLSEQDVRGVSYVAEDILTGTGYDVTSFGVSIDLAPYQVAWLRVMAPDPFVS